MIKLVSVSAAALLFCSTAMAQDMSAQPPSQGTDAQTGTTTPDMGPTTPDSGTMSPDTGTATPMPDGSTSDPRSEEHTSELQSLMRISYAVFCLKKKNKSNYNENKY